MYSLFSHCFPHSTSCTDLYESDSEYECIDDVFDLNRLTAKVHGYYKLNLTIEASRKLGNYLLILMWNFIIKSTQQKPFLFRVRDGHQDDVKILEQFCVVRHRKFSQQVCENFLFENDGVDDDDNLKSESMIKKSKPEANTEEEGSDSDSEYEGEKRIKLSTDHEERNISSLSNYFSNMITQLIPGELRLHALSECLKYIEKKNSYALTFQIEMLRDMVLKYFEYTPPSIFPEEEREVNLYFIGMAAILEYFAAEMIELAGNATVDADRDIKFISSSALEIASAGDAELQKTLFFHLNLLPIVDLNYFYGAASLEENQKIEIPSITELINENSTITTTKSDETLPICCRQLPAELHSVILRNFYALEDLLEMRFVCKLWNYFILNDSDIWKHLIRNAMIYEGIFKNCDSTFSVEELERIVGRGLLAKPLNLNQQVINYFYRENDWKSLYFILVRGHLTFLRDLELMRVREFFTEYFEEYEYSDCTNEESYTSSKEHLQIGITNSLQIYSTFAKHLPKYNPMDLLIPKDSIEEFKKIDKDHSLLKVIDFSQYSTFINCRLFPPSGLLYCFLNKSTQKAHFLHFEKYSLHSSDELMILEGANINFTIPYPLYQTRIMHEQIVVNQPFSSPLFYLQQSDGHHSSCNLAPSCSFNENKTELEKYEQTYQDENVVLFSGRFFDDTTVSIYISRRDLIERKFSNAKIYSVQSDF